MDNRQKVVIGVLVAVVLLFVVAVVVQTQSDEGDAGAVSSDREGLLQSIGGDPAAVRLDELSGDCVRPNGTLIVQGSCDLEVAASDQRMRLVRLRTLQAISISAPAPEEADFDIEDDLEPGKEVEIAVDRDGAEIELNCGFGNTCTLTVLGGGQ